MSTLLGTLSGILYAIMNTMNSVLGTSFGQFSASVIIHIVGLFCCFFICLGKLKTLKGISPLLLTGGALGVLTVIFSSVAVASIGLVLTLVLSLVGQTLTSIAIDHYGILGMEQRPFTKRGALSLCFLVLGLVVMILWK